MPAASRYEGLHGGTDQSDNSLRRDVNEILHEYVKELQNVYTAV